MILNRKGQLLPETVHDHGPRPECLNVKFRHTGAKADGIARRADCGRSTTPGYHRPLPAKPLSSAAMALSSSNAGNPVSLAPLTPQH